jgi:general secretion pathway protein A
MIAGKQLSCSSGRRCAIYEEFYGLKEMPFSVQPDPRFAYPSAEHKIAIAKMRYAADQKRGLAVLTGPVGAGKTTVANQLQLAWADDKTKSVAFLPSAAVRTPAAFLRLVLEGFGQQSTRAAGDNRRFLELFLLSEYKEGRHAVLLLDEGQNVSPENIDTIADLTNFQTARSKLITVVMLAQDNLANKLERKEAFRSRIAVVGHLDPLSFEDMVGMIGHRLKAGGAGTGAGSGSTTAVVKEYFDEGALHEVYAVTRGVPRDICVLCDACFVNGYVRDQRKMDAALVEKTVSEMSREKRWPVEVVEPEKKSRKSAKAASPAVAVATTPATPGGEKQ